jgi:hypothetical protein
MLAMPVKRQRFSRPPRRPESGESGGIAAPLRPVHREPDANGQNTDVTGLIQDIMKALHSLAAADKRLYDKVRSVAERRCSGVAGPTRTCCNSGQRPREAILETYTH